MDLSIIIPVYNCKKYLAECIDSIMEIDTVNCQYEVLLLDDGSDDGSLQMCQQYKSENVRILHHDNHGVSYTRNRGIQEAKGKYVMFVDADDQLVAGWSQIVTEKLDTNYDIIYFLKNAEKPNYEIEEIADSILGLSVKSDLEYLSPPWSKLFRRELLQNYNIHFEQGLINGEDALFNLKVLSVNASRLFCKNTIYKYRVVSGSATRRYNPAFYNSNLLYLDKVREILSQLDGIDRNKSEMYFCNAFVHSVYLFTYLITQIKDDKIRRNEKKRMHSLEMEKFFKNTSIIGTQSLIVNLIYILQKKHHDILPYILMRILNIIRTTKKRDVLWINI